MRSTKEEEIGLKINRIGGLHNLKNDMMENWELEHMKTNSNGRRRRIYVDDRWN